MDTIRVPAPPKQAFNMRRPMSDLIKSQIKHLKHVEYRLPQDLRDTLPKHSIVTENDAAIYIAAMTGLLLNRPAAPKLIKMPAKKVRTPVSAPLTRTLSLAASAERKTASKSSPPRKKKTASKNSTVPASTRRKQP